jgi:hypothetical protein
MTALALILVTGISQGESQGRSRYDAMRAAECVDTLRTSCADIETSCQIAIEPLVEPGGACAQNNQCTGGLSCINETDSADGTCAALLGIGEACERDNDCASSACSGTCVTLAAPGETCFVDSACASAYCDFETNSCAEAPYSGACEL